LETNNIPGNPEALALAELDGIVPPKQVQAGQKCVFSGKRFHLTYSGHLDLALLHAFLLETMGEMEWWSLVHENGSVSKDSGTELAYAHTHVALCLKKRITWQNARKLDFNAIHPNIRAIVTDVHAQAVWKYHEKAPIQTLRSENSPCCPENWLEVCEKYKDVLAVRYNRVFVEDK